MNQQPKTAEELLALPVRGEFSQQTRTTPDGNVITTPVAPEMQAFFAESDTVLNTVDAEGTTWKLGKDSQGWYRHRR